MKRRWFLAQSILAAGDWPEFRGRGDSLTTENRLPLEWSNTESVAWSVETPGYGQSSPVVHGKRIFITAVDGKMKETLWVACLNLGNGRIEWKRDFSSGHPDKWSDMISKGAPTPCVDRDHLYVFFESGDLMALRHDGTTVWRRNLTSDYGKFEGNHGIGSSLRLSSAGIVVLAAHGGPSYLLTVDRKTGKNVWKTDRETKTAWTTPLIQGSGKAEQIVISVNGTVAGYDAHSGREHWAVDGFKGNLLSSATIFGDTVVAGSSEKGQLAAISIPDGKVKWKAENATSYFGSPLVHRGRVWFAGKVGVGWCLDFETGREIWNGRLAGECWASPVGAGDRVYFFTVKGVTEVYAAAGTPERIASNTLDNMERTYGVAVADHGFILRSGKRVVRIART